MAKEEVGRVDIVVGQVHQQISALRLPKQDKQVEQQIPQKPYPMPDFSITGYIEGLGVLFLLLGVLWFGVRLLKKYSPFSFIPRSEDLPKGALRMEAQMPLGPRKGLMVVRFLDTRFLLGVTDQQITVLSREPIHNGEKDQFATLMEQHSRKDP